jgi:hypothetical protein
MAKRRLGAENGCQGLVENGCQGLVEELVEIVALTIAARSNPGNLKPIQASERFQGLFKIHLRQGERRRSSESPSGGR